MQLQYKNMVGNFFLGHNHTLPNTPTKGWAEGIILYCRLPHDTYRYVRHAKVSSGTASPKGFWPGGFGPVSLDLAGRCLAVCSGSVFLWVLCLCRSAYP